MCQGSKGYGVRDCLDQSDGRNNGFSLGDVALYLLWHKIDLAVYTRLCFLLNESRTEQEICFGGATQDRKIISSTTLRHEKVLYDVYSLRWHPCSRFCWEDDAAVQMSPRTRPPDVLCSLKSDMP